MLSAMAAKYSALVNTPFSINNWGQAALIRQRTVQADPKVFVGGRGRGRAQLHLLRDTALHRMSGS